MFMGDIGRERPERSQADAGGKTARDEQEKRYRQVFENSSDAVFILDVDAGGALRFGSVNPAAEDAFGFPVAALKGLYFKDIIRGRFEGMLGAALADHLACYRSCLATGMPCDYQGPLALLPDDGCGRRQFDVQLLPLVGDGGVERVIGIARDITLRLQYEEELRRRARLEREFRTLAENSPDIIVRFDPDCRSIYVNPAYEVVHRMPIAGVMGESLAEMAPMPAFARRSYRAMLKKVFASGIADEFEMAWRRGSGQDAAYHIRAVPEFDEGGRVASVLTVARDVSVLKRTERDLRESRALLQKLSARREKTREEEHKRIARDLHEELGQSLTALRMRISMLSLQTGVAAATAGDATAAMLSLVDRAIRGMRDVVASLRPTALDAGLAAGLEWLAGEFSRNSCIGCGVRLPERNIELDDARATAVFRIVQEALTNVARHAGASRVRIVLECAGDRVRLTVRDNGRGFDVQSVRAGSFGILNMSERALMLGGEFRIHSAPTRGTAVRVSFPTA